MIRNPSPVHAVTDVLYSRRLKVENLVINYDIRNTNHVRLLLILSSYRKPDLNLNNGFLSTESLDKETTLKKIDEIIRTLSSSKKPSTILTDDEIKSIKNVDTEDKPKLVNRLEDLVVLLRDDPDNKQKINDLRMIAFDEFGHVSPVRDVLESVKSLF